MLTLNKLEKKCFKDKGPSTPRKHSPKIMLQNQVVDRQTGNNTPKPGC